MILDFPQIVRRNGFDSPDCGLFQEHALGSLFDRPCELPYTYSSPVRYSERSIRLSSTGVKRMQAIMQQSSDSHSAARVAIVVNSDSAYGMVELRTEMESQQPFRVFRDIASAEAWLGI